MKHTQDTPFYRVSIENSTNQMKKTPEYLYEDIAPLAEAFVEALYEHFQDTHKSISQIVQLLRVPIRSFPGVLPWIHRPMMPIVCIDTRTNSAGF